jgi:hypothetical protein
VYVVVSAISIAAMTLQGTFSQAVNLPGVDVDEEFQERVQLLFPFINLLSPFLTAGVLAILQPRFYFQLHLAFSLHFWTFFIAISTPMIFINPASIWSLVTFAGVFLISCAYLFFAHLRVYAMPMLNRLVIVMLLFLSVPLASLFFGFALFSIAAMLS